MAVRAPGIALAAGALVCLCIATGFSQRAHAQRKPPTTYVVDEFRVDYAVDHPQHPPIEALRAVQVPLLPTRAGYRAPRLGERGTLITIASPPSPYNRYQTSALQAIGSALVEEMNRQGIDAVLATFPDIEEDSGEDLRPRGEKKLRIKIWTGRVVDLATFTSGTRFGKLTREERTNRPEYDWILERSPMQPDRENDLIRTRELEDFATRASRHPGRQVEAKLSPGELPGTSRVDYQIAEDRPWFAYFQLTNTGTDQTTDWRERFGFVHNQLTGRDDILRLDYLTGSFTEVNGVWGSYDSTLFRDRFEDRLRGSIGGSWSQYDASEVGISFAGFEGDHWDAGGQALYNVFQRRDLFVDFFVGLRWQNEKVDNQLADTRADEDFFLPEVGLLAERRKSTSNLYLHLAVERNLDGVANTDPAGSVNLGRLDPDVDFTIMKWQSSFSFFLEPVLDPVAWKDPRTPQSSTLAHEMAFRFWGQTGFGSRLVPQFQEVAGGLYSVRGYEQSILAGDTVLLGSIEYRFHLPRAFYPNPQPMRVPVLGEFRDRPQYVFGRPDWDLIFRLFFDVANVRLERAASYGEFSETIKGVGGGIELQILRNFNVRCDVGVALDDVPGRAKSGDVEPYLALTLVF
jgi:hemolysin activation/secretion protein